MNDSTTVEWAERNRRHLVAALGQVRRHLERHAGAEFQEGELAPSDASQDITTVLDTLCESFRLSGFERGILLLCAGVELDASFARLVASIQESAPAPTFSLALAALPDAHWSALSPASPLRRWRLIEVGSGDQLVTSALRIDERVLHHLTGLQTHDEQLAAFVRPLTIEQTIPPSQVRLAETVADAWSTSPTPIIQLIGSSASAKRAVAGAAARHIGLALHTMSMHALPAAIHEREVLMRLWERESILTGSALLIEADDARIEDRERLAHLADFGERTHGAIALATHGRMTLSDRPSVVLDVTKPDAAEQREIWRRELGEHGARLNGRLDQLVQTFDLDAAAIRDASRQTLSTTSEPQDVEEALWTASRRRVRPRLDDLARAIEPVSSWDDLVLPDLQMQMLREVATQVRQRMKVYDSWGFRARSSRGLGISALFAGPSGTGKTMAAEVLAKDLDLDLYHIDLSRVVSKYIGETEKNLSRVFDAAEEGGAILLFDEADALFGKRSEVKDSHDRYANLEVSYLLQRMESYRGLAILTTNMKGALDDAFIRRLRFIITFPFPDAAQRSEIWLRIFPKETPTEGLDVRKLARLNVAGGNIRNIALSAAFLAADEDEPVRMTHVLRAARSEYAKMDRSLTESDFRGWV